MALVHKTQIVPMINVGTDEAPDWVPIKKSTAFTLSTNAQTKDFDFISSKMSQTEVDYYKPSLDQELTMFTGEEDYKMFFDLFYDLPTGTEAHRDVLIAFYQEEAKTPSTGYSKEVRAWLTDATVTISQLDSVNGTISISLGFNEIVKGAYRVPTTGTADFASGTWTRDENGDLSFVADSTESTDTSNSSASTSGDEYIDSEGI